MACSSVVHSCFMPSRIECVMRRHFAARRFWKADLIISKGQGNYESLEGETGNIFFLLRAKCPLVAKSLGVSVGDCVLKRQVHSLT